MAIIHIITTINRGGAENQLIKNIVTQRKRGLNVTLIFLKGNAYWKNYLENENIKVFGPFFKNNYLNFRGILSIFNLINKKNNILHCHMPPSLFLIYFISFFIPKNKIIYTSHNDEPFIQIPLFDLMFSRSIINLADQIVAITPAVKKYLIKKYHISNHKIKIITYSFDPSIYLNNQFNNNEFNFYKKGVIYIGTVARLVPQKRIDILIKSFKIINSLDQNIILVILGNGPDKDKLLSLANDLGLKKNIIWLDYTEFVIEHMKKWNVFCLTSEYEGFGLVLLEAMHANLPIVAMDVSSIKNIIGPCGEAVEFGKNKLFASTILKVLKNKQKYLNKNHLVKFCHLNNLEKHLALYNSLN